jgi:hypothetical protein
MTPAGDRATFTAIVLVSSNYRAWRCLPPSSGVIAPTARDLFVPLNDGP